MVSMLGTALALYPMVTSDSVGAIDSMNPDPLPFSFVYDGKPSGGILPSWSVEIQSGSLDANPEKVTTAW